MIIVRRYDQRRIGVCLAQCFAYWFKVAPVKRQHYGLPGRLVDACTSGEAFANDQDSPMRRRIKLAYQVVASLLFTAFKGNGTYFGPMALKSRA